MNLEELSEAINMVLTSEGTTFCYFVEHFSRMFCHSVAVRADLMYSGVPTTSVRSGVR